MAETSLQAVVDGITLRLREYFPDARISIEDVPQAVDPGAFFVRLLTSGQRHDTGLGYDTESGMPLGVRYRRACMVEITYFPAETEDENAECIRVQEILLQAFEMIKTPKGDWLSGRDIQGNISDNVLTLTASYPHFVRIDRPYETMEHLKVETTELFTDKEETHV